MSDPLGDVPLAASTAGALEHAAARLHGRSLETFDILAAIVAVDRIGNWDGVQLRSTFISRDEVQRFRDARGGPAGTWRGIALTREAGEGLRVAANLARRYDLLPMPPGILALGMVCHADSGAARALLEESDVDHAQLIELIQDEILGMGLERLDTAVDTLGLRAQAMRTPVTAPGVELPAPPSRWPFTLRVRERREEIAQSWLHTLYDFVFLAGYLVTLGLIILAAVQSEEWWKLAFVVAVLMTPGFISHWPKLAVAAALAAFVSPLAGAAHLISVLADGLWLRAQPHV